MLRNAGVPFVAEAARVDEDEIKRSMAEKGAVAWQVAEVLAELKARRISQQNTGALVIGADQMLVCEGEWFDKPKNLSAAAEHLRRLGGRPHELLSCVCVLRDGATLWHRHDRARLTMRPLSDAFIADYLEAVGESALDSVGAYQLEGQGAQLFTRVEGDFFTILGLPLLPLLDFLRAHRILAS